MASRCRCAIGIAAAFVVVLACIRLHLLATRRYLKYHLDRVPESHEYRAFLDHFPLIFQPDYDWEPFFEQNRRLVPGGLIMRFDWYMLGPEARFPGHRRGRDPATVFILPDALDTLLRATKDMDGRRNDRVLVIGGTERSLSSTFGKDAPEREARAKLLRRWFGTVFFYVKDVDVDGVKTMPHGLMHIYLCDKKLTGAAMRVIAAVRTDAAAKPKAVLAAWSVPEYLQQAHAFAEQYGPSEQEEAERRWPAYFERMGLPVPVPDRAMCELGWRDRTEAQDWAETPAARGMGVELRRPEPRSFLETLSQYRFALCPFGSGIQSAKIFEALLVFTVPIVRRLGRTSAYDDLIGYGFPLLVVDSWSELTRERLDGFWASAAPGLPRFRHRCMTADGFWRIFTGANHSCL